MNKRMAKLENMISNMCNNNNNNNRGGGGNNNNNNHGDGGHNNNNNRGGGNNNNNNNGNGNGNVNRNDTGGFIPYKDRPYHKQRNMGAYCHSHGFHLVGANHKSGSCKYKHPNHNDYATWTNWGTGGSTIWPTKVREDQKTHESYAGKLAPTN